MHPSEARSAMQARYRQNSDVCGVAESLVKKPVFDPENNPRSVKAPAPPLMTPVGI